MPTVPSFSEIRSRPSPRSTRSVSPPSPPSACHCRRCQLKCRPAGAGEHIGPVVAEEGDAVRDRCRIHVERRQPGGEPRRIGNLHLLHVITSALSVSVSATVDVKRTVSVPRAAVDDLARGKLRGGRQQDTSSPAPPCRLSAPAPPFSVSLPSPPISVSLPASPESW